ncbi:MAG: Penicillinase repressor [Microgenomates bacterium OLB23]|nr:MAG: Penicillinase repressor [Microgenomates bacterium OLB23]
MNAHHLSNLEQEVMGVIWQLGECTVRDVVKARVGKKSLAYTTIATIVDRLYSKKLLTRIQKGNRYVYVPQVSRAEFGKNVAASFIQRFMKNFG